MIHKTNVWVWSYNKNNTPLDFSTAGKWLSSGTPKRFAKLFPTIDALVEQGLLFKAKYTHKENLDYDPLPYEKSVLCVYADGITKEQVKNIIRGLGTRSLTWKYETQSIKDWLPGGTLYEKSQQQKLRYLYEHDCWA
ncbi:MAG: hypothetical protein V1725_00255 [archaeon]